MKDYLIAERYARALSAVVTEASALDPASEALNEVAAMYAEDHHFRNVLSNPAIDTEQRVGVLREILGRASMPAAVLSLVEELVRRGRIGVVGSVAEVFEDLVDARMNRITAEVLSATPLDEEQQARLQAALSRHTDREVRLDCAVDPELLGGVVAKLGSREFDGSVRTRLRRMRDELLAEG